MSLPTLPPVPCQAGDGDCYTPDQMTEYGQQCRAAALDDAASICDGEKWNDSGKPVNYITAFNEGCADCEAAIRRLK